MVFLYCLLWVFWKRWEKNYFLILGNMGLMIKNVCLWFGKFEGVLNVNSDYIFCYVICWL